MKLRGLVRTDALILIALALVIFALASFFDLFEAFVDWSRRHESWQLDEWAMAAIVLCCALMVFSWRRWRELEQERARRNRAEQAVEILEGILPICSHCKKIRHEGGRWEPVESYIRARSRADFSHGLCPDCLESLYPELRRRPQDAPQDT